MTTETTIKPKTTKRISLRKSINDKCKQCIYDPVGSKGGWKQQVENCTSYSCPLYLVRPQTELPF